MTVDLGANPHGVLGAHEAENGVVVRTLRPEARAVRVQPAGIEAELKDPGGLWEALLPKARLPLEYELEVEYPDGNTFTVRDPYSFLPTLGELDRHNASAAARMSRSMPATGIPTQSGRLSSS